MSNGSKAQGIYFESSNFDFQIQSSNKRSDYFQQVTLRVQICLLASSKLLLKVLGRSFEKNRFLMLFLFRVWALEFRVQFWLFWNSKLKAKPITGFGHPRQKCRVKLMSDPDSLNFCAHTWLNHFDSCIISLILAKASMTGEVHEGAS